MSGAPVSAKSLDIRRKRLETLQVNMGNLCNQRCMHCHVDAGPHGDNIMSREIIDSILEFLASTRDLVLDVTGGAPELNPGFEYFISSARPLTSEIMVRSNLTVFFEPGKEHLPLFLKEQGIHLICSLPCYTQENVDMQRGNGVFRKSIRALRMLNELGFGRDAELQLDLVYNPLGAFLPSPQEELEADYKRVLGGEYRVSFDRLMTITNVPVKRFRKHLDSGGSYDDYMDLLKSSFNSGVLEELMCRTLLSVAYDGTVCDCDFNTALGLPLRNADGSAMTISQVKAEELVGRPVDIDEHCFSCTAGCGSSCQGSLAQK